MQKYLYSIIELFYILSYCNLQNLCILLEFTINKQWYVLCNAEQ